MLTLLWLLSTANLSTMGRRYRLVVYYGGEFMTRVKWQYTGPTSKVFEGMEVYDMTIKQVRDLVADVVTDKDRLYFMKDGVTPDHGYALLVHDSQLKELAIASNMTGVCKIHVFHSWSTATAPVCVEEEYLGRLNFHFSYLFMCMYIEQNNPIFAKGSYSGCRWGQ